MMSVWSWYHVLILLRLMWVVAFAVKQRQIAKNKKDNADAAVNVKEQKKEQRDRAVVNGAFFRKLRLLLAIMVPGVFTAEFG
jgi:hypothetical protein